MKIVRRITRMPRDESMRYFLFAVKGDFGHFIGAYPTRRQVVAAVNSGEGKSGHGKANRQNAVVYRGRRGEFIPGDLIAKESLAKLPLIDIDAVDYKKRDYDSTDRGRLFGVSNEFDDIHESDLNMGGRRA